MPGQFINHFGAVRIRVTGSGNLKSTLISLNDIATLSLANIVMSSTDRFPTILANFMKQQAQLKIETTDIHETFLIKEIIIYTKPVFTAFPQ